MEIRTKRLVLRPTTWSDIDEVHRIQSIPQVDEYNTLGIPKDIDETCEVMKSLIDDVEKEPRKAYSWTIFNESSTVVGLTGMFLSADKFKLGEIFYKFDPAYWGNGYATEVAQALIKFGFTELGLHKVEAGVATENIASIRVLEKSGMTREGLRRKILPIRGEWKDNYHYAIVEDDPRDY